MMSYEQHWLCVVPEFLAGNDLASRQALEARKRLNMIRSAWRKGFAAVQVDSVDRAIKTSVVARVLIHVGRSGAPDQGEIGREGGKTLVCVQCLSAAAIGCGYRLLVIALGLLVATGAMQAETPELSTSAHLIVTGEGSVQVPPDMVEIRSGVTTTAKSVREAA
jgi:hypothetical protein